MLKIFIDNIPHVFSEEEIASRFKKVKAAGGLVIMNNQILLIKRKGKWDLPKGKLDEGESLEICALREVMEETGIANLKIVKPLIITHHTYSHKKEILKEVHWFLMSCENDSGMCPQEKEDITEIIWDDLGGTKLKLESSYKTLLEVINMYEELLTSNF